MRLFIDCELSDASALSVCLNGLEVHSDVEAFRFPSPAPDSLTATWLVNFPSLASLETFAQLMESIPFLHEDFIRLLESGGDGQPWTLSKFHKAVLSDHLFLSRFA